MFIDKNFVVLYKAIVNNKASYRFIKNENLDRQPFINIYNNNIQYMKFLVYNTWCCKKS